jgi:hypothetical protein
MTATVSPTPSIAASVPPGGTTPLLCPDGSIAPDGDLARCGKPSTTSTGCPDGQPAPDGDPTHCPPEGAPANAWVQNKHGEWIYRNAGFPGWVFPLSKNRWIHRAPHFVLSDGALSINKLLALAGQSAPANAAFFTSNPNLRNVDPNAALPSGTIVNVPRHWEAQLSTSGLQMNQVGVGAQQPCPPSTTRWADGLCHPLPPPSPTSRPCPPGQTKWADGTCHPLPPPSTVQRPAPPPSTVARPCPPGQTKWADGSCHPLPPSAQPSVTTGWISAPSGHRWYRSAQYPGMGYDPTSQSWVNEAQLAYAAAVASGDTVGAQQLQYATQGGAVQAQMAQNAATAAQLTAGQQYGAGSNYSPAQAGGWQQGPRGSWRYLDPRYPGYGYDWQRRQWLSQQQLATVYGG